MIGGAEELAKMDEGPAMRGGAAPALSLMDWARGGREWAKSGGGGVAKWLSGEVAEGDGGAVGRREEAGGEVEDCGGGAADGLDGGGAVGALGHDPLEGGDGFVEGILGAIGGSEGGGDGYGVHGRIVRYLDGLST